MNKSSSANTNAADFSVDVRDELDNAKESLSKARHMLNIIFQTHDFSQIDDPLITVMGVRRKPVNTWNEEESKLFSWTERVNETMTSIRIIDDYTERAFAIIDAVEKDMEKHSPFQHVFNTNQERAEVL